MNVLDPQTRDELVALVSAEQERHRERLETATQVLHNRRHWAGTASSCGRCRADVEAVAAVLGD